MKSVVLHSCKYHHNAINSFPYLKLFWIIFLRKSFRFELKINVIAYCSLKALLEKMALYKIVIVVG